MIFATKAQSEIITKNIDYTHKLVTGEVLDSAASPAPAPTVSNVTTGEDVFDTFTVAYLSVNTATNRVEVKIGKGGVKGDVYLIKCSYPTVAPYSGSIEEQIELRIT